MVDDTNRFSAARTRRSFLATTGAGVTVGLAGCIGGDDGDDLGIDDVETIRMQTSESGTTAHSANVELASFLNDHLDDLSVEAQTSDGTEENIGDIASGDVEMAYIQNWSAREFDRDVEPYDALDFELTQIFHYYDLPWYFVTGNSDLESVADIEDGMTVSPTPSGSGTAPALETALELAVGDGYERVSESFTEQGGAINEGRLDVGVGTLMNFDITPAWVQEMSGSVDDLRVLDVDSSTGDEWRDDDMLLVQDVDTDLIEGDVDTPGEIAAPTFAYNFVSHADLDYDAVYEFLETMYDVREDLGDASPILGYQEDEEFWVENMYDDLPFHPAAADFYEEIGVWRDEFERADE